MKKWWPLLLFLSVGYLVYLPTVGAGFVTDFIGFLQRVETHGPGGFIHSFGFPALQPVLNAFLISFYQLFGTNGWPWFLIFTGIHGLNAYLVFKLCQRLFQKHLKEEKILWPLLGGLIFLLSPYHSEAVVWKVCFNFLFSSFLMLSIFHFFLNYLNSSNKKWILFSSVAYLLALLTFELPIIFPVILFNYVLFFHINVLKNITLNFLLPLFFLLILYFAANKLILQDWVGHYGADTHLNVDLQLMTQTAWKYTLKHLGFVRFYSGELKTGIFNACNHSLIFYGSLLLVFFLLSIGIYRRKKWSEQTKLIWFSIVGFFIALLPVLNLFFYTLQYLENDRYGYFPMVFLSLFLVFVLKQIPKNIGLIIAFIYLAFSLHFSLKINNIWGASNRVVQGLLNSYEWGNEKEVYLLNLPENMHGVYMFRDHSGKHQSFAPALKYLKGIQPQGTVTEVIQYNLTNENNGATVHRDSLGNINLELREWGSWWWRKNLSGGGYENDRYKLDLKPKKYSLTPNPNMDDAIFLIHDGLTWKQLQ